MRLGLDESLNGSNGHFGLLDAKIYPVISGGANHGPRSWSDRASLAPITLSRLTTETMPRALGSNRALRITSCSRGQLQRVFLGARVKQGGCPYRKLNSTSA
jgi:hypothetical protein